MTAEDNIAVGAALNGHVYNFWQDRTNVLGLWRRTTVASYKTDKPEWETIIDFDVLSAKDGVKWVFSGASRLYPDFTLCLVSMSPDGGDASEMREFDIAAKSFVEDGFRAPASKSGFSWLDRDTVIVSAAFEEEDKTQSGYPRVVKLWRRGTKLEDATPIFEAEKQDLAAGGGSRSTATGGTCSSPAPSTSSPRTASCGCLQARTGASRCRTTSQTQRSSRGNSSSACVALGPRRTARAAFPTLCIRWISSAGSKPGCWGLSKLCSNRRTGSRSPGSRAQRSDCSSI
ncbi:hypothetical protein AJ88_18455 [Mesorhizobium amorphae CCBAU 01583]|nr:hypothetical protein AJ88_18455 [Mesorhizobium amorphae CCBAU 01583]